MEKEEKKEESSEDEEEGEEFQIKNRKKKFELSIDEIKAKYKAYLNCKLKYPKSQFCYFYFKGTCLLGDKCQFCHGYEEFSMDRFFEFLQDEYAMLKSSQKFYQKFYFNQIISPDEYTYDNLLEYQEKHPELFTKKYTFEDLKKSRSKRLKIRKLLTKDIIDKFLEELFNRFNHLKSEQLIYYLYHVGYPQSIKQLIRSTKICFPKNVGTGKEHTVYFIKYMKPEEMINIFVKNIIEYMKDGKFEDYFPLNYSKVSKILYTKSNTFDPNLSTYAHQTKYTENEFLDILIQKLMDECNKGNFNLIKNKTKQDLFEDISYTKIIQNIYENHFKLNDTKFSCFNFDQVDKLIDIKSNDRHKFFSQLKFLLFNDGNLFFFNNENELSVINYNKFQSFNIDEFYNNKYYFKNCFEENKIANSSNDSKAEIEIDDNIKLDENNIYNIDNTIINFINDENSFKFFKKKSKLFKDLSIDIEGSFSAPNIRINLIQICDDTDLKNDIYVIDFHTFKLINNQLFTQLSILLKDIFENRNIKKIFFDGRSDLLSLHKELNICAKNFIDLSSLFNAVNSYKEQNKHKNCDLKSFNECLNLCKKNYYFKGLNRVLELFHSKNCFNPLKVKYHKLFNEKPFEYWAQRPILKEFLLYSALDVKYEYDTYNNLKKELKNVLMNYYSLDDISENNIDLMILLISYSNHNAACNSYQKLKELKKDENNNDPDK